MYISLSLYTYIYIYVCMYTYIYICIYVQRERERERLISSFVLYTPAPTTDGIQNSSQYLECLWQIRYIHISLSIYIYIYIYRERETLQQSQTIDKQAASGHVRHPNMFKHVVARHFPDTKDIRYIVTRHRTRQTRKISVTPTSSRDTPATDVAQNSSKEMRRYDS